jgi:hypothetical protein
MFAANISSDVNVTPLPSDGISDLAFSPVSDLLAATSWDNQVPSMAYSSCVSGRSSLVVHALAKPVRAMNCLHCAAHGARLLVPYEGWAESIFRWSRQAGANSGHEHGAVYRIPGGSSNLKLA